MPPQPTLLIATKLHRPSPRPDWVPRSQLLNRLDTGLAHKLTLISAPAGFGKTTLVCQWITHRTQSAAWLSLDPHDDDPAQFLRYFIAAIRTCVPDACPTTHHLVTAPQLPDVEYLTHSLMSELTALPAELVLVLDDYHHVRSPEIHSILRHLLCYLPPSMHLVILTRFDPPLHLGRLRMTQQITELRAGDLRFGPQETRQFLAHRLHQVRTDEMTGAMVEALHARTDGWITGLELSSISLQRQALGDIPAHFHGSNRLLVGYLVEEVMTIARRSPSARTTATAAPRKPLST